LNAAAKRRAEEHVGRELTRLLGLRRFIRGKPTFWVRPRDHIAEFIHLHQFSFAPRYRVHCGLRVLNDTFDGVALNGPTSDEQVDGDRRRYELIFDESEDAILRCAREIDDFCLEIAEPWFRSLSGPRLLLESQTPLCAQERRNLELSYRGEAEAGAVRRSRELLGVP